MKKSFLILLIATAVMITHNSCGSGSDKTSESDETVESETENPTEITLRGVGNDMAVMKFDLDKIIIDAGKEITITLINEGIDEAMKHNVVIIYNGYAEEVAVRGMKHAENSYVQPDDEAVIAYSPLAEPGQTVNFKFTIDEPGTYQFICTYPGHWSKMMGILSVK